ncbi:MAG: 16S rRNA (guanine(966)-N(2))-methyltransferase RsmD [Panacagrimonas sp.]
MRRGPQTLRIIGGTWRSRRVEFVDGDAVRPTPDRVRQTLFDWLAPRIEGASVLDLFAGSGALGLEALSRGAAQARFVELGAAQAESIRATLRKLGAQDRAVVDRTDALRWLGNSARGDVFDCVFLDPPYSSGLLEPVLAALPARLKPDNRIYLEWPEAARPALPAGYEWLKEKSAGRVSFGLACFTPF